MPAQPLANKVQNNAWYYVCYDRRNDSRKHRVHLLSPYAGGVNCAAILAETFWQGKWLAKISKLWYSAINEREIHTVEIMVYRKWKSPSWRSGIFVVARFSRWTLTLRLCHRLVAVKPFTDEVSDHTRRDHYNERRNHGYRPLSFKIGVGWHRREYTKKFLARQVACKSF